MATIRRVYEKINLFFRIIFINKRYTLVAFIGLGISLALVAESLIFLYSFQYDAFNTYIRENPEEQITITPTNMINTYNREDTIVPELETIVDKALVSSGLEGTTAFRYWINRRAVVLPYTDYLNYNNTELVAVNYVGVPSFFFDILSPYIQNDGTLPLNSSEVLLLLRPDMLRNTNLSKGLNNVFTIYNPLNLAAGVEQGIPAAGATLNITGVIDVYELQESLNNSYEEKAFLTNLFSILAEDQLILSSYKSLMDFTHGLTGTPSQVAPDQSTFIGSIAFNLDEIDAFNLKNEIEKFIGFTEQIRSSIEDTEFTNEVHLDLNIIIILQDFVSEFEIFRILIIMFMIPMISMALSLTAYSSNLIKKRRKRQLGLLNMRGSSQAEIVVMLLVELVIFTAIAIVLAFILAYPYTFLILKSAAFLNFTGPTVIPRFFVLILEIVIIAGFIGSLLVNVGSIRNLSQLEKEEAFSEMREKKPFWERFYIDIFLLVVGIIAWVITWIQLKNVNVSIAFARLLGTPAPILVIIGTIMVVTRLFPIITKWLSKVTWKFHKLELLSIAFRSLGRRRSATMRSLVLVMLTFTMATVSIVIPDSYQGFDYENAAYTIGSDIVISNVALSDKVFRQNIEAVEGVEATTYVTWFSTAPITRGSVVYHFTFMGINTSEFGQVGYFDREYLDSDTMEIISKLDAPLESNVSLNIIMQHDQSSSFNVSEGDLFDIYIPKFSGSSDIDTKQAKIVDFYNFWPVVYVKKPTFGSIQFELSLVASSEHIFNLSGDSSDFYTQLFVKVKDGYATESVVQGIEEWTYGRKVDSIAERVTFSEGSLRSTVIFGALNSNFIASILILVFAMSIMMVIHTLERTNEVGIMKTIGISPRQLFSYFYTESFTVLLLGAFTGILLGVFASYMFMSIIAINSFIPPWEMVYSPLKLILTIVIMFGASILSSAIPGVISVRKEEAVMIKEI
ncbi:MAG: FtsX-like permease family protein [Candidatus Heimdallarchaeota archaeon]